MAELGYDSFHAGWHPVARVVAPAPACDPHDLPSSANLGNPSVAEPSGTDAHLAPVPVHPNPPAVSPADVAGSAPPSPEALRAWEAWFAGVGVDSAEWLQRIESSHGSPAGQRIHPARAMAHDTAPSPPSPSSSAHARSLPAHGQGRSFRFAVHVEVIVHGSTEPDAVVTVGGRRLALRKDGSFSVRWLLPDGDHRVPLVAMSQDGRERRDARLRLARATDLGGEVGVHALAAGPADPIAGWAG